MSYQVLARKWRPRLFNQLVGQEHVVKALSNALDNDRLHHAYLFTGTRGVGKTTLARILAKSLNCEHGVSSTPCGVCNSCREVDEGRFVDLLEVDAASRTKVDQTRELLENVPFAPVRGRYKVYLIDEVHMFSASSFNALLKTLEEPPPHVKFVLATTDPQKVPVTVLSRCLQFNLKRLTNEQISGQLQKILEQEQIAHDAEALTLLARGADGSMRDGLSLLDQAIAFGGGEVKGAEVREMLGTIGGEWSYALLDALAASEAAQLLQAVASMAELAPDYATALQDLLQLLHQVALCQLVPGVAPAELFDAARVSGFAEQIPQEDLQLFYQIGLKGQEELPLAPTPRSGFEMVLLRMLAFRPVSGSRDKVGVSAKPQGKTAAAVPRPKVVQAQPKAARPQASTAAPAAASGECRDPSRWGEFVATMRLGGIASQLAGNCTFGSWDGTQLTLKLDPVGQQLRVGQSEKRLQEGVKRLLGEQARLVIVVEASEQETPAKASVRQQNERQQDARTAMQNDPFVREMEEHFDAQLVNGSIRPVDPK